MKRRELFRALAACCLAPFAVAQTSNVSPIPSFLSRLLRHSIEYIERHPNAPVSIALIDFDVKPPATRSLGMLVYVPAGMDAESYLAKRRLEHAERHRKYREAHPDE